MQIIKSSKTSYVEYVINQSSILLSENAIASKYFSLQFKRANYCINTGNAELNRIGVNFVEAPLLEYGFNFAHNEMPYVESFVFLGETSEEVFIKEVHHFFYLNEEAMSKMTKSLTTKNSPNLSILMFLSDENLARLLIGIDGEQHSHSHDSAAKSFVITSTDFSIFEDDDNKTERNAEARMSYGLSKTKPDWLK